MQGHLGRNWLPGSSSWYKRHQIIPESVVKDYAEWTGCVLVRFVPPVDEYAH